MILFCSPLMCTIFFSLILILILLLLYLILTKVHIYCVLCFVKGTYYHSLLLV